MNKRKFADDDDDETPILESVHIFPLTLTWVVWQTVPQQMTDNRLQHCTAFQQKTCRNVPSLQHSLNFLMRPSPHTSPLSAWSQVNPRLNGYHSATLTIEHALKSCKNGNCSVKTHCTRNDWFLNNDEYEDDDDDRYREDRLFQLCHAMLFFISPH